MKMKERIAKVRRIWLWIKWRIPQIRRTKNNKDWYSYKQDGLRIEVWKGGNCSRYVKPKMVQIGFSGSMVEPYSTLHIYIWRIDIRFGHNPLRPFMDWYNEYKLDKALKAEGMECPNCGSHRLREGNGFAYEPLLYCKACGIILWSADPEPYII